MKFPSALFTLGSMLAPAVATDCSADCMPNFPGGPYSCDNFINIWQRGDNESAWGTPSKDVSCDSLEEFNCCDCSGCECTVTTTTTTTTTTTVEPDNECLSCWGYLFGGNSSSTLPNDGNFPGYQNQFFEYTSDNWLALGEHRQAEGCEAAALNGLDCSSCGCDCGLPPADIDCEQTGPFEGDCDAVGCGQYGQKPFSYITTVEAEGLGRKCAQDYSILCGEPCNTTTSEIRTTTSTTTTTVTFDCNVEIDALSTLGGTCNEAASIAYCFDIFAVYEGCFDTCGCICENSGCNSRPFNDEAFWPARDGICYPTAGCVDPCTEYIGVPDVESLAFTCEDLLQTNDMDTLEILFALESEVNHCAAFDCCGVGIPVDSATNVTAYECYEPTTLQTIAPTTGTTSECDVSIVIGRDSWSANELIDLEFSCFQIANAIGGVFAGADATDLSLANFTFYPTAPPSVEALDVAKRCGCEDSCDESTCAGCYSLMAAFEEASFDDTSYFCSDYKSDFNMDCEACGCSHPDPCDDKILFASENTQFADPSLDSISCNQLSVIGLSCDEIASYTAFHGRDGACDSCNCTNPDGPSACDTPCGGGMYGGNSSSGAMNTSQILSCNNFVDAGLTCEEAEAAGCSGCDSCGCVAETTTSAGCGGTCNDLYLSCDELVEFFTCSELTNPVFDGCGCDSCGCVEAFTETTCEDNCMEFESCDFWVSQTMSGRNFYTCENLEDNYGCDCSGCECVEPDTTTPEPKSCSETTSCLDLDCETVATISGFAYHELESLYGCDCEDCGCDSRGCQQGYSCDEWQDLLDTHVSCDTLESDFGCECKGCECKDSTIPTTTIDPGCVQPCDQLGDYFGAPATCDDVFALENSASCAYLEGFFGCDCTGCECGDVPTAICA